MSSSLTLEQVVEQALKEKVGLEARVKYLYSQLGQLMQERRRNLRSLRSSSKQQGLDESNGGGSNPIGDSGEDKYGRRSRRHHRNKEMTYHDFKVDILEFEGQLDPDLFLDWLQTIKRVFEFKDISDEKKVKLIALKLGKYASLLLVKCGL